MVDLVAALWWVGGLGVWVAVCCGGLVLRLWFAFLRIVVFDRLVGELVGLFGMYGCCGV